MEHKNPLVSVIVVNYHQSKYLKENLESIFTQSYNNIEIIAGDAHSQDESIDVYNALLEMSNRPFKKFYSERQRDFNEMLNECIALCEGKYIKILSADDYMHPDFLTKTVQLMEQKGESCGMVFTDCFTVDQNSVKMQDYLPRDLSIFDGDKLRSESLIQRNRILVPSTLIRKTILLRTGRYVKGIAMEDYDRWMKIINIADICYIDKKLAFYRRHPENKSAIADDRLYHEDIFLKLTYDKKGIVRTTVNKSLAGLYIKNQFIPRYLIESYNKYPYRNKVLSFLLINGVPAIFYKLFFKLKYG